MFGSVSDERTATGMTTLLQDRPGQTALEPLDCSTPPALDLCTRPRQPAPQSPCPEGARHHASPPARSDADSMDDSSVCSGELPAYRWTPPTQAAFSPRTKPTRPFKAYPKDPFYLALGAGPAEPTDAYAEFRQKMLQQVRAHQPAPGVTNPKMRRSSGQECGDGRDASYWEKRRKNNEAAKRSRDARRAKEDEIAIRAAFLEQENLKLKYEVAALRNEAAKLRCLLYN